MISYNIKSIRKKPLILINLGYFFFLILLLFGCGQNIDNHGHYDKIKKEVRKQKSQIHKLQINSPSKPVIAWMDSKQNSNYQIKWNMWWGINGNNAVLIENNKEIEKQKLSPKGFNGQQGSFQFINKKSGLYEYRVKLCLDLICSLSEIKSIQVGNTPPSITPPQKAPGKPAIAWTSKQKNGNFSLNWNMWWGENGSKVRLIENSKIIIEKKLSKNSPNPQKGKFDLTSKANGSYQYIIELCNTFACTKSQTKAIDVVSGLSPPTQKPNTPNNTPEKAKTNPNKTNNTNSKPTTPTKVAKVVAAYFPEWGVYGRKFHVSNIPAAKLSHILYAFGKINSQSHKLEIWDKFASLEKSYPGDKWDQKIKGSFNQLQKLYKAHPHLKILYSIGGWTGSDPFYAMSKSKASRKAFIDSVINFLKIYPFFSGVDLDWEYPGKGGKNPGLASAVDKQNFSLLIKELKESLDKLGQQEKRKYQLTAAVSAAPSGIAGIDYSFVSKLFDYIFVMSYDFHGAWENLVGHHTPLYLNNDLPQNKGFSTHDAVKNLIKAGAPANKLVIGAAFYGRSWRGVTKNSFTDSSSQNRSALFPIYGKASGGGPCSWGSWDNGGANCGVMDYKDIVKNYGSQMDLNKVNSKGYQYFYDQKAQAAYLWNAQKKIFISYDSPQSIAAKTQYLKTNKLAGIMFWEISADNGNLLDAINIGLRP